MSDRATTRVITDGGETGGGGGGGGSASGGGGGGGGGSGSGTGGEVRKHRIQPSRIANKEKRR